MSLQFLKGPNHFNGFDRSQKLVPHVVFSTNPDDNVAGCHPCGTRDQLRTALLREVEHCRRSKVKPILIFNAHGNPESMDFGKFDIDAAFFEGLDLRGVIVGADGCNTGSTKWSKAMFGEDSPRRGLAGQDVPPSTQLLESIIIRAQAEFALGLCTFGHNGGWGTLCSLLARNTKEFPIQDIVDVAGSESMQRPYIRVLMKS